MGAAEDQLLMQLADPMWRICSGKLYKILIKGDDGEDGLVLPFLPNRAQRRFIKRLWHRNIILKARQLGFTTLIAIMWLDHALFNADSRCGIIAQDKETAQSIFRDKVIFAFENLPPILKEQFWIKSQNKAEIHFGHNNSMIRVATSVRGGTFQRLLVSEFGKIGAKHPIKAREVVTGSIPTVPKSGVLVIESTAEGQSGEFYKMTTRAIKRNDSPEPLGPKDYRFHFYPWHAAQEYRLPVGSAIVTSKEHEYFDSIEQALGVQLDDEQRTWWVATRDNDFSGEDEKMWQEYPSTPSEAFQKSTEGCYYTKQMTALRKQGRLCNIPLLPDVPCFTFWDIGASDGTAIWVMQKVGLEFRFVHFHESWSEPYAYDVKALRDMNLIFHTHFLPHDADHVRKLGERNISPKQMLEELMPTERFEIVPRIQELSWGIQQTRDVFPQIWIDKERCAAGVAHLDGYKKKYNAGQQVFIDEPLKTDGNSEAADALRQFAQALKQGMLNISSGWTRPKNWRTV